MSIPVQIIYNLLFILIGLALLALFFSWSFANGYEIHSCGGPEGCSICPDQNSCVIENLLNDNKGE